MIRIYFLILFRVVQAWLLFVITGKSKLYYSSIYLFSKQSFRLPESANKDIWIIFKSYIRVLISICKTSVEEKKTEQVSKVAMLDSSFNGYEERLRYLNYYEIYPMLVLSREALNGGYNFFQKIMACLMVTKLYALFWPAMFSKKRVAYALLLRESLEWFNVIYSCRKNKISELFVFSIYEKDSNFLAYLLMKEKITVSKVTSEVPITFANKIILTNHLYICFNYQKEEVVAFNETLFYDTVKIWMPEMQLQYLSQYTDRIIEIPINTIGFYSGACWLRKKLDHTIIASIGSYDAEEAILKDILSYLELNTHLKLIIFLHPIEKRSESNLKETIEYYNHLIKLDLRSRVELFSHHQASVNAFDKINIGVSLFSTIMFERLSLGFKCLLNPVDRPEFPLKNSPFRNICAYSKEELFIKLDMNLVLNKVDFFRANKIENYVSDKVIINYNLV